MSEGNNIFSIVMHFVHKAVLKYSHTSLPIKPKRKFSDLNCDI